MKNIVKVKSCVFAIGFALSLLGNNASAQLVTHYTFDGNALDSSGFGHNGTVHGATLTTDRFGNANSAYRFDGVNDYISASATGLPTAARTVAFWFNADTFANHPVMLGYGGGSCGTSFFVGANATLSMYNNSLYVSSHCNVNNLLFNYGGNPPVASWNHLAVTTDVAGTKMYLNGSLVASNSNYIHNTAVAGRTLAIGVDVSPGGGAPYVDSNVRYFAGTMDDVRIYNNALSSSEILGLVSAVPEPETYAMLLAGLGLLGFTAKRRKQSA